MKKLTAILANLVVLTSCGVENTNDSKTSSYPQFVGLAHCQEANVDHGFTADIKVDRYTGEISRVIVSEVTIEDVVPVATLTTCKTEQSGEILSTHCREDITDSYTMNITQGGLIARIDAVLRTGKTGKSVPMTCEYYAH